jgi:CTP:molybdopterin cytidylyltransferase MocA
VGQCRAPVGRLTASVPPSVVILAAGMARRYGGCKPLAPIGPRGEAVIDLVASDALAAGFGLVVLVLHPETGPAIRYHVERTWPSGVAVEFTTQRLPLGTVHAVLAAREAVGADAFAVGNADDVYGREPMGRLADQLASAPGEHALVGFTLDVTVGTDDPVTRGICRVDDRGYLAGLDERRHVARIAGTDRFRSDDGRKPAELAGDLPASMNLGGFQPGIWDVFAPAMEASGLNEEALLAEVAAGREIPKAEVLLPEVVAAEVAAGRGLPFRVLPAGSPVVGVTHASDLPAATAELARQIALGTRAAALWGTTG